MHFLGGSISASENASPKRFCCRWIFCGWSMEGSNNWELHLSSSAWELLAHNNKGSSSNKGPWQMLILKLLVTAFIRGQH